MSLRLKALLSGIITLMGLIVASHTVLLMIVPSRVAQLEAQEMQRNGARVLDALAVNRAQLESATSDWARWDDTYDFIENANKDYIKSNLANSVFTNLRLNLMVFVHSSGRVVFSKGYDLQNRREMPASPNFQAYLARDSYMLNHTDSKSVKTGIIPLPEGPLLVASLPILTSEEQGPIRGTLVFGRFLDAVEIARLAQTTHLTLALQRLDDPQLSTHFQTARAALSEQTPVVVRPLSEQTVAAYALVKDLYGKPAYILSVETSREIYQQGQVSLTYLMWVQFAIGAVFAALVFVVVERLFLARIRRLSHDVQQIGAGGDLARRVFVRDNDEISSLASEINRMLGVLQTSEQRYRDMFEGAPMIVYALDSAGRITALNPAFERVTGWTRAEWLGRSFAEIVPPQDLPEMQQLFQEASRGELPKYASRHILSKAGDILTVELVGLPQMENGKVVGVTGFALDITARKRAEDLRMAERNLLRTVIDAIPEIIFVKDTESRFRINNSYHLKTLGVATQADALGKTSHDFFPPDLADQFFADDQRVLQSGQAVIEKEQQSFDHFRGERRWHLITRVPLRDLQGKIIGVAGVARDITERKRAEEALRESEERWRMYIEQANDFISMR